MLFNEPKLLKYSIVTVINHSVTSFSALQRAEIAETALRVGDRSDGARFSALQRAEIAETRSAPPAPQRDRVSVLFNEPKLLKSQPRALRAKSLSPSFSALQRAEIAEIDGADVWHRAARCFSALQRAEIAEIQTDTPSTGMSTRFQCSSTSRNC